MLKMNIAILFEKEMGEVCSWLDLYVKEKKKEHKKVVVEFSRPESYCSNMERSPNQRFRNSHFTFSKH